MVVFGKIAAQPPEGSGVSLFVWSAYVEARSCRYQTLSGKNDRFTHHLGLLEASINDAIKLAQVLPDSFRGFDLDSVIKEIEKQAKSARRSKARVGLAMLIKRGEIDGDWDFACKNGVAELRPWLLQMGLNDADLEC